MKNKIKKFLFAIVAIMFTLAPLTNNFGHNTKTKDVVALECITVAITAIVIKFAYQTKRNKFIVTDSKIESAVSNGFSLDDYMSAVGEDFDKLNFDKETVHHLNQVVRKNAVNYSPKEVGEIGMASTIAGLISGSVGDVNIKVKRNSANINISLPFVLFGQNGLNSSFDSIIRQFLPSGIDFSVAPGTRGTLIFTYAQGDLIDTVTVSFTGLTNYLQFMSTMNQKWFRTKFILYTISDVAQTLQYDEMLNFGTLSSLGALGANQLDLDSRIMTDQFQRDRVNVLFPEQKIDADFSFVQNIIPVANFVVKFNMFMSFKSSN